MINSQASAIAHPNIAFIKYWGERDPYLHLPASGSISMNLDGLLTRTTVTFDPALNSDRLILNGEPLAGDALRRVSAVLERVRQMAGSTCFAEVVSVNNFPAGAGIASSASAFAALSLAASAAAGLELSPSQLSRLARLGSGSACRSVPAGFVEWRAGESDEDSYAYSIAPPEHWDLTDCIALVSQAHKSVSSTQGHLLAETSPLHQARITRVAGLLHQCRQAILERDFESLAQVTELDCHLMHAVMMTSSPPLIYWQPATLSVMQAVIEWRKGGIPVCYTIDAGPNVHVLCPSEYAAEVSKALSAIPGVTQVLIAHPGGAARLELP